MPKGPKMGFKPARGNSSNNSAILNPKVVNREIPPEKAELRVASVQIYEVKKIWAIG